MNTTIDLSMITRLLPLLIPVFLIQMGLLIAALIDVVKRERTRGPKWVWILVIVFVNIIGPIIYFAIGREDE